MEISLILGLIAVVLTLLLTFLHYFLLIELKKSLGYLKFIIVLFGYVITLVFLIFLLTGGYINLFAFVIAYLFVLFLGVLYLERKKRTENGTAGCPKTL